MRLELHTEEPWWLTNCTIRGFEGDGDAGSGSSDAGDGGTGSTDDGAGDAGDAGDQGSASDAGDSGDDGDKSTEGLKSALQKERAAAKKALREKTALERQLQEIKDKDLSDADKAKKDAATSQERVIKLAAKLKTNAVESAIVRAATGLKFRDIGDALAQVDRSAIGVEQDTDDPSEVTIDAKTVEKAVKALADKKPYLLVTDGEGTPSGSKFGGGNNGGDKGKLSKEALEAKYPGLRQA